MTVSKMKNSKTNTFTIGHLTLGGKNNIIVQSMTNTNTSNTLETINQIIELQNAGCELVRVSVRNINEAKKLENIRQSLRSQNHEVPLCADVHFNPQIAEIAAQYCEKVRINPGNYISEDWESQYPDNDIILMISEKLTKLTEICQLNNTAIRIGVNHGSLSKRILKKYGNTAEGMVESLMEFVEAFRKLNFHKLVVALKASDVMVMIKANILLKKRFIELDYSYPFHLGVTEAGNGIEGRVKSAAGIGYLLSQGIGDTIRVSLSENPVNEIPMAKALVYYHVHNKDINICKRETLKIKSKVRFPVITNTKTIFSDFSAEEIATYPYQNSSEIRIFDFGSLSGDNLIAKLTIDLILEYFLNNIQGVWLKTNDDITAAKCALLILQITGLRKSFNEFVSCPTCARTKINVEKLQNELKEKATSFKNIKIAVMGCIVNGPGEMQGADFGILGSSLGKANIYVKGKCIEKNIPEAETVKYLMDIIQKTNC